MKKNYLRKLFICAFLFSSAFSYAQQKQDWVEMMQNSDANFFETQKVFYEYEQNYRTEYRQANGVEPEKVPGYKIFKRWEWFMAPRVSETGERFAPDAAWKAMEEYNQQNNRSVSGNWSLIGPSTFKAGRLNFVRIHPKDTNIVFVGSPAGGLWKSNDGGTTWSTNTDWVAQVIGCTDIGIDPVNPNIMYLVTGDGDGGDTYSVGLLKSTDAGATWKSTGLSFAMSQARRMSKILIHPTITSTIIVATGSGIYRSTDAGATFTVVQTGSFKDMEFKPDDPNTVYASGATFYKSTDNGLTWTKILSGLPTTARRIAIGVTPADANMVYLLAGTLGVFKSTDSGTNFTSPSIPDIGNQETYDLCIAVSHGNKNEVLIGGQTQFWKSVDGGVTWTNCRGTTHVDYHDLVYINGSTAYVGNDGGIWRTRNHAGTWTNLNKGLATAQMYGFGQSATNPTLNIQGWQDNGTNRFRNGTWSSIIGGDGMLCFISWNNDLNMWGSQYNGSIDKSTDGGASFTDCKGNITGTGKWVTPWIEDPVTANTIYAGYNDVWKHTSGGGTTGWTQISNFGSTSTLAHIAVSPVNNKIIWATSGGTLYKTIDGGTTWTTFTNEPAGTITYIACSKKDANKAWITYSGFTSTNKVFQTNDMGATWVNLSTSLPNIPMNCITVDKNNDALYLGTDIGVFYRDPSSTSWQSFSDKLPNVIVTQLEIFYPGNKLRASTYGRGMWESDLYSVTTSVEKQVSFMSSLKTFPNPSDGHFNLEMNIAETNNYIIEIHNTLGELVYKESLNNFKGDYCKPFDISTYGKGMYTLSVTNSENKSVKKVIVY